jgi:hypothetical protein
VKREEGWFGGPVKSCKCCLKKQELTEVISQKDLTKNWDACFLTPDMMKAKVRPNIIYTFKGKPKLLLLRNAISKKVYDKTVAVLQGLDFKPAKGTNRNSVKQLLGGDLLFGWYRGRPNDPITAPTRDQYGSYRRLWPVMLQMHDLLETHMSEYFKFHAKQANRCVRPFGEGDQEHEVVEPMKHLNKLTDEKLRAVLDSDLNWFFDYLVGATAFSTITVNKSIVFGAHQDGNNIKDTLGCIATFGEFAGGALVFPRFGVGADIRPRDMLVADSNTEYHGNLGPTVGTRYSIVGYLHNTLLRPHRSR